MRVVQGSAGFTLVELLVTVVLAGIFLAFFTQMFRASSAQQISTARQSRANNIAFSNLNKFPRPANISPAYVCDPSTTVATNTNNLAINPNAAGTVVLNNASSNREPTDESLGSVVQEVRAFSPQGCVASGNLVKLVSKVQYGYVGQRDEVVYATYVQD